MYEESSLMKTICILFLPPPVLYPLEHMPLYFYLYMGFAWGFFLGAYSFFIKKKQVIGTDSRLTDVLSPISHFLYC